MKVLILNASPRINGTIDQMTEIAVNELTKQGVETEIIKISQLKIKPCIGCMVCRSKELCVLPEDDGHRIAKKINDADHIIVSTPVYWANIPGNLKVLFDRIVYVMMGENKYNYPIPKQKGKSAIILCACTTNSIGDFFAGQSRGVKRALKEIFFYSGIKTLKMITKTNTKNDKEFSSNLKNRIKKAVKRLFTT